MQRSVADNDTYATTIFWRYEDLRIGKVCCAKVCGCGDMQDHILRILEKRNKEMRI